ncbi:hypothetical protein K443DRAFT_130832 [Laccaria amethystina LaAM-08-1]|uniref:Unplaced genomic scaffold K443scaffold_34, whole genome shotgun sequence n=1 Tax=Laccaria amethystina LaAM-08-1 TaxID=1095629 RepID=A0A0C9Y902_9AGAR|nr:hypothetical protein K443DRAFT_130832 [Laccaria amethystina LaAM-08-1]
MVDINASIVVDKSRGEKLTLNLNVTLDIIDISGEHISHSVLKVRLDKDYKQVPDSYNGLEPEERCCNTCEDLRLAYMTREWSFSNPEAIEQRTDEGCNIEGLFRVNKVIGNIYFSTGRSFQTNAVCTSCQVPYLRDDANRHDHIVRHLVFEDDEYDYGKAAAGSVMRKRMGLTGNPLDGAAARVRAPFMFQYFLKIVSTRTLDDREVSAAGETAGRMAKSRLSTGAFFNFEISPILVVCAETRQSFAQFLTSICAIIGGVLTVASIIDSILFATYHRLKDDSATAGNGYGKLI